MMHILWTKAVGPRTKTIVLRLISTKRSTTDAGRVGMYSLVGYRHEWGRKKTAIFIIFLSFCCILYCLRWQGDRDRNDGGGKKCCLCISKTGEEARWDLGTIMMARCSIFNKHFFSKVSIPPPFMPSTKKRDNICFCISPLSNCAIIAIMCKDVFMRWLDIGARVLNIAKRTVHIVCTAFLVVKFTVSPPRLFHCTSPPSPPSPPPERDGCNHQISVNITKTKTNPLSPSSSSENPGYDCQLLWKSNQQVHSIG